MVPDIAGKGYSFAGALRYYMRDKRQPGEAQHPTTSERAARAEVRNLPIDNPRLAIRLTIATASQAEELKRRAGVKVNGRRYSKRGCTPLACPGIPMKPLASTAPKSCGRPTAHSPPLMPRIFKHA